MKFYNTNGKEYSITIDKYRKGRESSSELHTEARSLLHELYPCDQILEELPIKIDAGTMYLDFFLPTRLLAVEVNGSQHSEFNSFFYKNKMSFLIAKKRDKQKSLWCDTNKIDLVVLEYDRINEWTDILKGRAT